MTTNDQRVKAAIRSLLADPALTRQLAALEPSAAKVILTRLELAEVPVAYFQDVITSLSDRASDCYNSTADEAATAAISALVAAAMAI